MRHNNGTLKDFKIEDLMYKVQTTGKSLNTIRENGDDTYIISIHYKEIFGPKGIDDPDTEYFIDIVKEDASGNQERLYIMGDDSYKKADGIIDDYNNWISTIDLDECLTEEKQVIYKDGNSYKMTPKSNFQQRIRNNRLIQTLNDFDSAREIMDYYNKYFKTTDDDFEILNEDLEQDKKTLDQLVSSKANLNQVLNSPALKGKKYNIKTTQGTTKTQSQTQMGKINNVTSNATVDKTKKVIGYNVTSDRSNNPEKTTIEVVTEDYQEVNDDWGQPKTYDEIQVKLKYMTNDFSENTGAVETKYVDEKSFITDILNKHYEEVEIEDVVKDASEKVTWTISYSHPIVVEEGENK